MTKESVPNQTRHLPSPLSHTRGRQKVSLLLRERTQGPEMRPFPRRRKGWKRKRAEEASLRCHGCTGVAALRQTHVLQAPAAMMFRCITSFNVSQTNEGQAPRICRGRLDPHIHPASVTQ